MKKGFFILLVACFVLLALGKVAQQVNNSWQHQQKLQSSLETNLANQKAKLQEMDDDIARTRAKSSLSDHDRWLIGHLTKSRERLAAAIDVLEKNQQRFHQPMIRQWIGHGVMLIVFVVMGGLAISGRSAHLTGEEKRWLETDPEHIPGLQLVTNSQPLAPFNSASNFITGRIKPRNRHELTVTRSTKLTAMGLAFILAPQGTLAVDLYTLVQTMLTTHTPLTELPWNPLTHSLMVSLPFTLAGLYVLFFTTSGVRIDRRQQQIRMETTPPPIAFRDVQSLQFNQVLTTGQRSFINCQIQLNLQDGRTVSLLNHAGKEQLYVDLIRLALFMDKPVVMTTPP